MSNTGFPFGFGTGKPVQQPPPNGAYPYSMYYGQDVPPAYQQQFGGPPFGDQIPVPHAGPYGYGNNPYMQQYRQQQQMMTQYAATQAANHVNQVYQSSASRANPQQIADSIYSMTQVGSNKAYQQQQHSPFANPRQSGSQTAATHIHTKDYSASPGQTSNNSIPPLSVRTGPSPALSMHSPAGSNHSIGADRPLLSPHGGQPTNHPYSYHPATQSNQFYQNNNQQQPLQPINKHLSQQPHNVQSNSPISPLSCQNQTSPHFQQPLSQMSPRHSVNGLREPHQSSCALAGNQPLANHQPNTNNLTITGSPQPCMQVTSPKRQRTLETSPLARTPSIADVNPSEQRHEHSEALHPPDIVQPQPQAELQRQPQPQPRLQTELQPRAAEKLQELSVENHIEHNTHNDTAEHETSDQSNNISTGENMESEFIREEPSKPAVLDMLPEDSIIDSPKSESVKKHSSFSSADESFCSEAATRDPNEQSGTMHSDSLNSSIFSLSKSNGSFKSDNLEDSQSHLPLRKRFKHQSNESLDQQPASDNEERPDEQRSSTSSQNAPPLAEQQSSMSSQPAPPPADVATQPTHSEKINGAITTNLSNSILPITAVPKIVKKRGRPSKDRIRQREAEKLALALALQSSNADPERDNVFESPTGEHPPKKRSKLGRPTSNGSLPDPRERSHSINSTEDTIGKFKKTKASVSEMQKALMKVVGSETIQEVEIVKRKRGRPPGSKNKHASKKRTRKNSVSPADMSRVSPAIGFNLPYTSYDSEKSPLTIDTRVQPALPVSIPLPHQNNKKPGRRKSSTISPARRPGSSTAEPILPAASSPWQCIFCQTISNHAQLGDLFGGYSIYPETPVPLKSISGKPPPKHRPGVLPIDTTNCNEVWFHEKCVVWSSGVHMMNGNIYGVYEAITLALNTTCSRCHGNGAMIGCYYKGCPKRYHITCAENDGCSIKEENFSIYCPGHKDKKIKLM